MSDKQGKCETCRWWDRDSRTDWTVGFPINISECKFMPVPIQKSANSFCGQWKEKNPPHLLETLPGHTEWSRELHGYDILLECQRSATAISRGNKWFIPFCAAPQ